MRYNYIGISRRRHLRNTELYLYCLVHESIILRARFCTEPPLSFPGTSARIHPESGYRLQGVTKNISVRKDFISLVTL